MKVLIIFATTIIAANAILKEYNVLAKELSKIEKANFECTQNQTKQEQKCCYKTTLSKINYDQTAAIETASYRDFCKTNTTSIKDKCEKSQEFVYCLHRKVQNDVNKIRDKCVEEHGADMQAYRTETLENLVKQQSYACFMFCFLKNIGNMNEDLSFNFEEPTLQNLKIQAFVEECIRKSSAETTKCSQAASRYYCMSDRLIIH